MKRPTLFSRFRRPSRHRAVFVTAAVMVGLALPLAVSGAASATLGEWESFHEEGTGQVEDFCGVAGLTMENSWVVDGVARTTLRGPDRLPYYEDFAHSTDTWTNVATEELVTVVATSRTVNRNVTDNGDGTLTVTELNFGIVRFYDGDGRRIKLIAGQLFGHEALIDHAGTPSDPSDDEFLAIVRDLGGKIRAFCPTVVRAIG